MTQDWNNEAYYDEYYDEAPARQWSTLALVLSGLSGILIGFACAACVGGLALALFLLPTSSTSSTSAPAAVVVAPAAPQPVNPAPMPTPAVFVSGGLGLTQAEWEQRYGPGTPTDQPGYVWYQGGTFLVAIQEEKVSYIERQWPPESGIPIEEPRRESGELIPSDSQYLQTYSPEGRPDLVVDLYLSPSLAGRFSSGMWPGGQPGNFTVTYTVMGPAVTRMVIGLGNNPS